MKSPFVLKSRKVISLILTFCLIFPLFNETIFAQKEVTQNSNTKALISDYKEKKDSLKNRMKANLTKEEKEVLKNKLKILHNDLKSINQQIKTDFEVGTQTGETVLGSEPNYLFELQETSLPDKEDLEGLIPNDPEYENQWGLRGIINDKLEILNDQTEKTIVALIDTGVDYNHEDLAKQIWTSSECIDDLGNLIEEGCQIGGYDFVDNDNNPFPSDGYNHGTFVAGILGAKTNNNLGIASLSNNGVQIMPSRACCTTEGFFEVDEIVRAVYFAVNNGAKIINMSFGGPTYSTRLQKAIDYARANNVIVVAAAGNYGMNNDEFPIYPASYDLNNIIAVAALDQNDDLAYFSNYGVNSVDIAAPGVEVLSTTQNNNYEKVSGTSFATPFVVAAYAWWFNFINNLF